MSSSKTIDERMDMFKSYLDRSNMEHKTYQYEGVRWCIENELRSDPPCGVHGGFIADEMGLGKTIMAIGLMYSNFVPRTLIIVPPVLLEQWFTQIYKTTGHQPLIFHGSAKKKISENPELLSRAKIVISTYGAIVLTKKQVKDKELTILHKIAWSRVIFDEAHHLRNANSNRCLGARLIRAKCRWLVSGTPVQNKKQDFYSLCGMIGLPASFYAESKNLKLIARSFILKRTKKQVGIQMTDVCEEKNIVDWRSQKEMQLAEELHSALEFSRVDPQKCINKLVVSALRGHGILSLMLRAKQSCIYPKLMMKKLNSLYSKGLITDYSSYNEALEQSSKLTAVVDSILENKGNGCGKLVFCHFREEIDEIEGRLIAGGINGVATFDGRTSHSKRQEILNGDNEVLILQIQTGCEGLNLQEKYSEIYFVSPHWNPAVEDQAIARCHRIGQKRTVYVRRFEMRPFASDVDSRNIEKYVGIVQETKRMIAGEIIEA